MCFIHSVFQISIIFISYMSRFAQVKKYHLLRAQSQPVGQVNLNPKHLFSFLQPFPISCIFIMSFILTNPECMIAWKLVAFVRFFRWFKELCITHVHTSLPVKPCKLWRYMRYIEVQITNCVQELRALPSEKTYHLLNFCIFFLRLTVVSRVPFYCQFL